MPPTGNYMLLSVQDAVAPLLGIARLVMRQGIRVTSRT